MSTPDTNTLKEFARHPYAWPGGYPLVLVMSDGECLCSSCTRQNYREIRRAQKDRDYRSGWCPVGVDIHWEGAPIYCAQCNTPIESAYGDPEEEAA